MRPTIFCLFVLCALSSCAQNYNEDILKFRQQYRNEFLTDAHSPLTKDDTANLRFYSPDERYRVEATFTLTADEKEFDMPTHSGKTKKYRKYGQLAFTLNGSHQTLDVYQGIELMKNPELKDYLFIPFRDATSGKTTYGGGRYLDISTGDIKNGKLVLDFNKCYNPYCAYAEGYSCPIPPEANRLKALVEAGEKNYGKAHEE